MPNNAFGMCTPADFVRFTPRDGTTEMRLNDHLLNVFQPDEVRNYPTPCKGRYVDIQSQATYYPMQYPYPLDILPIIPQLAQAGVDALKIEGRQRSRTYIQGVGRVYRAAIDLYNSDPNTFAVKRAWLDTLASFFGEDDFTRGCYLEK